MPWGRLDDQANSNAKLIALSDAAWRMWGCALIYCQANLTDGFVPEHAVHTFGVRAKNKNLVIDELCSILVPGKGPLWERVPSGFQIHDYLDWNDSREEILIERAKGKARVDKWRAGRRGRNAARNGVSNGVTPAVTDGVRNGGGTPSETHSVRVSTTTTTKEPDQDPRSARFAPASLDDVRSQMKAAAHRYLDANPAAEHGSIVDLVEELKQTAARLRAPYNGREVQKVVDAVIGERARRRA